jgi:predicted nucleic acid-binding protein
MITAVDSSVLLDVFTANPTFGAASREALRTCRADGSLVACEVVWAEVGAAFGDPSRTAKVMEQLGIHDAGRSGAATGWQAAHGNG